ncbi:MAG: hypothetical protein JEZ04_15275 [Spirochaetales bacterium]|nr:hypothetical protein [Spirochaetales bacterium]
MKYTKKLFFYALLLAFSAVTLHAQNTATVDLNTKYKYPFAFSLEYRSLSPLPQFGTDYGGDFLTTDFSASAFLPLDFLPVIQPFARIGMITIAPLDPDDVDLIKFTNTQFYASAGAAYKYYFSKQIEIGASLGVGLSQVYYEDIMLDGQQWGQLNFFTELGANLGMNLSYNVNLSFNPALRFTTNLNETLPQFDGFSIVLGFAGSYRLGEDPDAPQAEIRSIKAEKLKFPAVFAPMQSYYSKNPITTITLKNIEKLAVTDVDVSFFQAGFMDTPTKAISLDSIKAGASVDIDIFAIYNQQVFTTEGITPLTGEVLVEYKNNGRIAHQKFSVSYDLYDKESLTWDDDRKVSAFITPADSALRNYSSYVRQTCKDYTVSGFSPELQTAMQIYYALAELGVLYQRDPTSPFEAAQENPMIVDAISLPRNTLKRATGDCDDLTVLFCSLLESVGIETAFITVPGHIYSAFKTSTPSKNYRLLHPEKNMTLNIDGELWIPVEITLMGEADFLTAWRTGIEEFSAHDDNPEVRALNRTREAQETYRPVMLTEKDLGLQYGDRTKIIRDFKADLDKSITMIIDDYETEAKSQGSKGSYNRLGITCAQLGKYNKAEQAFNSALTMDRNYLPPKINLGNVYFMRGEYQNALRLLHGAEKSITDAGKISGSSYSSVLLSISKCYYELENFDKANEYMKTLAEVDPAAAQQNSYLASGESGQRASDRSSRRDLMFADE